MFEKYINWDRVAIEMLRQKDENDVALMNLREEYATITDGLGAVDYGADRVNASPDNDGMINRYIQKASIEEKIRELVREERMFSRAWDALTEDERRILTEFFRKSGRPIKQSVDILCDVYGYERTKIYNLRRDALHRFKRLLVG